MDRWIRKRWGRQRRRGGRWWRHWKCWKLRTVRTVRRRWGFRRKHDCTAVQCASTFAIAKIGDGSAFAVPSLQADTLRVSNRIDNTVSAVGFECSGLSILNDLVYLAWVGVQSLLHYQRGGIAVFIRQIEAHVVVATGAWIPYGLGDSIACSGIIACSCRSN